MRLRICAGLLLLGLLFQSYSLAVFAQTTSPRPEGWQGSWPGDWQGPKSGPQGGLTPPGPQRSIPPGSQTLEVPPHPQSLPESPRQQAAIPPRPQPEARRPQQLITVTVTDPQGRYVNGLQQEDFVLYEDGEPQTITYFNTGENEPVSLGIIVDVSGSMTSKIDRARFALHRLIETIRPQDEVFLSSFNAFPRLLQDFTDSRPVLFRAITYLRIGEPSGTALYDALLIGHRHIRSGTHQKKALIVISDGQDNSSRNSLNQVIDTARRSGVLIYAIGIGRIARGSSFFGGFDEPLDVATLQKVSELTGGKLFTMSTEDVVGNANVLEIATQTISRELRSQYSLGYTPSRSGSQYRGVRVEARTKDADQLTVRTQQGYAADAQEEKRDARKIFRN